MDPIIPQPETVLTPEPPKHFLNKKFAITLGILILLGAGAYAGIWWRYHDFLGDQSQACPPGQIVVVCTNSIPPSCRCGTRTVDSVIYKNNQYGFSIALPDSWKGYTVLNSQWEGTYLDGSNKIIHGPKITLRHPLWAESAMREDMPVMIFTKAEWLLVGHERGYEISLGAAPFPPSMLGQNSKYVIALPARYNYDFKTGFEEVDQLVHNLRAFEPTP